MDADDVSQLNATWWLVCCVEWQACLQAIQGTFDCRKYISDVLISVCHAVLWPAVLQPPSAAEGWKGTTMEPHVKYFTDAFLGPLTASSKAALNTRAKQAAADQRVQRDVSW
jgi:hypothetical protein